MDICNYLILNNLRDGNFIRIKNNNETIVGTLLYTKNAGDFYILTKGTNYIGDMFTQEPYFKKFIQRKDCTILLINKQEYQQFKLRIFNIFKSETHEIVKQMYNNIIYKIDECINNTNKLIITLIREGYKQFPDKKKEIFYKLSKFPTYLDESSTFQIKNLIKKQHKQRKN